MADQEKLGDSPLEPKKKCLKAANRFIEKADKYRAVATHSYLRRKTLEKSNKKLLRAEAEMEWLLLHQLGLADGLPKIESDADISLLKERVAALQAEDDATWSVFSQLRREAIEASMKKWNDPELAAWLCPPQDAATPETDVNTTPREGFLFADSPYIEKKHKKRTGRD